MNERMKGFLGMLGKNLGITEAVNPQAKMQTGEALPTGQDQFNIARERADIPSPSADFADKSRIAKNTGFGLTQSMMRDFDPSDNEQVLQMQKAMNAAGIKGADGKALTEDGMIGKNTMRALRFAQGQTDEMEMGPSNMFTEENRDTDKVDNNPIDRSTRYNASMRQEPETYDSSQRQEPTRYGGRGSGTNRFGTAQGGRFDIFRQRGDEDGNTGFAERMGLVKRMDY